MSKQTVPVLRMTMKPPEKGGNLVGWAAVTGYVACGALSALRQDAMGLERYVTAVRFNWLDSQYTTPIAIVVLAACVIVLGVLGKREKSLHVPLDVTVTASGARFDDEDEGAGE